MRPTWLQLFAVTLIFKSNFAWAQSLNEVLIDVEKNNPEIEAAKSILSQTYDEIPTAWTNFLPNISLSSSIDRSVTDDNYDLSSTKADAFTNTLSLSQNLFNLQNNEQFRKATLNIAKQEQTFRSVTQATFLNVITAYLAVIKTQNVVALKTKNVEVLQSHYDNTKVQHEMRRMTNADLAQAESRLAQGKADELSSKIDYNSAVSTYQRLVGKTPHNLTLPAFENDFTKDILDIEKMAIAEHPDVLAAEINIKRARSDIESKKRAFGPSLALSGSLTKTDTNNKASANTGTTVSTLGLTFTMPLYQKGIERKELATAEKALIQAEAEYETAKRLAIDNTRKAWESMQGAASKIVAYRAQEKAATIALESIRLELKAGRRTVLNLLDSEKELLNARVNLASAEHDLILTKYELQERVGRMHTVLEK